MIDAKTMDNYELTIGIECHVQLKTATKLFVGVSNDARSAEPNELTSPLCFGMPGTLPVLNRQAVELAVRAGIALNAEIAEFSKFDRKHYFYPDLPKGYQITQFDQPTVGKGKVIVKHDGQEYPVGITRAHIEEDAGKSSHPAGSDFSLVDLNRAGTPLLEIVSEPDIHSAAVARAYAQELYLLMKYAEVSDVDLFHGNMRFDVNVSVARRNSSKLGVRAEVKNLNSFRSVEKAVEYEYRRQVELLESGKSVVQETRGWDEAKMKTVAQRSKEEAHDYRYFPDPDLPPIELSKDYINEIRANMPMLPPEIRQKLAGAGVESQQIQVILSDERFVMVMLTAIEEDESPETIRRLANWLSVDVQAVTGEVSQKLHLTYAMLEELSGMVDDDKLSSTAAKQVLVEAVKVGGDIKKIAEEMNLTQVSDSGALEAFVDEVLAENEQAAKDVQSGELKAIGFLVGQVMKKSKGQANPKLVQQIMKQRLGV